jgi:hypothetical protein
MKLHTFALLSSLAAVSVVQAQVPNGQKLPLIQSVKVTVLPKLNTYELKPQIDTVVHSHVRAPENESTPIKRNGGPANNLPVGGVDSSIIRGEAKIAFGSIGFTGWVPPDCDMGVSPNWIATSVNMQIAFHKKATGEKTFQQDYSAFFAGVNQKGIVGDPKTFFDPLSKRWFTIIMEVGFSDSVSAMLLAVSDDDNPNGTWYRYRIEDTLTVGSDKFWLDYPGIGVNKDTLVFTGNMFGFTNGYAGNQFMVLPKAPLLTGGAVTGKQFSDPDAGTVKVAINADPNSNKIYCVSFDNPNQLKIHVVENGATNPTITSTFVTIPTAIYPGDPITGPNGHNMSRFGDARLYSAHYRNDYLVTAHSTQVSGTDTRHMVRWYQLKMNDWPTGGKPTLSNVGNIVGGTNEHFHMPAINQNARGDIALIYTKTSPTIQADLLVSAHKRTDKYGVTGKPITVFSDRTTYGGAGENRWGDYFSVAVDPTDNKLFWGYGMGPRSDGRWATQVSSFRVSVAGDNAVGYGPTAAGPYKDQGTTTSTDLTTLKAADGKTFDVNSVPFTGAGQLASIESTFKTAVNSLTTDYIALEAKIAAPAGSTVFYYLWNTQSNTYVLAGSQPASSDVVRFAFTDTDAVKYVTSTGVVKGLIRVVRPIKGTMPPAFTLKVDELNALAGSKVE